MDNLFSRWLLAGLAGLAAAHFLTIKEFILWLGGMGEGKGRRALVSSLPGLPGLLGFLLPLQGLRHALGYGAEP